MIKKNRLFSLLFLILFCSACLPLKSAEKEISSDISQSTSTFLREKKPAHTIEILDKTNKLDIFRDDVGKENFNQYLEKINEQKQLAHAFPVVHKELGKLGYYLEGTEKNWTLSHQDKIIGTGVGIRNFTREGTEFVLCGLQSHSENIRCWTRSGNFDLGYNSEVFPRFFNSELWSIQQINQEESHYGVFKNQELLYQFQAPFSTFDPILAFEVNENGRWLSYSKSLFGEENTQDIIVHNEENLNQKFGRKDAFGLTNINNQIFYFFQKQGEIGYILDEKEFPLEGEEIANWKCCFYTTAYPDFVDFYFKKDGLWYSALLWL